MFSRTILDRLNQQLEDTKLTEWEIGRNERRLKHLHAKLKVEQTNLENLQRQLDAETLDVERLEGKTLHALFYILLGRKKEQLETERQEALRARYSLDHCQARITGLERDISDADKLLKRFRRELVSRDRLLEQKAALLQTTQHANLAQLHALDNALSTFSWQLRELDETIAAGQKVEGILMAALNSLGRTADWGHLDVFGGGLLSTSIKHSHIDQANQHIKRVEQLIGRFQSELDDLAMDQKLTIQIDQFDRLADYFFDGLLSDWTVQRKINTSYDNVRKTRLTVSRILRQLKDEQYRQTKEADRLKKQRGFVIESAE